MKRKFTVYLHKCLLCERTTGIYIGITSQKPNKRWLSNGRGYLALNKLTGDYAQPKMASTLLKYGLENWTNEKVWVHEILFEGLTKKEAEQKEIELIDFYNSYENGLNSTRGGSGYLKYLTEEEAHAAIVASRDKAHKKWNENPENEIKNKAYRHTSYLRKINDRVKYERSLAQKKIYNAKRRLDPEKARRDQDCKNAFAKKARIVIKELRQQIKDILKEKPDILTEEQYKIVFEKNGSHYKCTSVKKLTEILEAIK